MADSYNISFLFPAVAMLFWCVRIFIKKDVHRAQLLMTVAMFLSALAVTYWTYTALFIMPFYYMAIRVQTTSDKTSKWDYLMFLPAMTGTPAAHDTVIFGIIFYVQATVIIAWSFSALHRYRETVAEYYDTFEDSPAESLKQIVIFVTITTAITVLYLFLHDFITDSTPVIVILSAFLTLLTFMIGRYTYKLNTLTITEEPVADAPATEDEMKDIAMHTDLQRIEDEKMYLDPMLSLASLAEKLSTNRTYISNSIHKYHNQNFADFINTLRIRHAIELMKNGGKDVNIKDVAMSSGYSHLQSFYRNFAVIMQMTPKTWLAKNNQTSK